MRLTMSRGSFLLRLRPASRIRLRVERAEACRCSELTPLTDTGAGIVASRLASSTLLSARRASDALAPSFLIVMASSLFPPRFSEIVRAT